MPKTYVISDLHGRHDLLTMALKKIEEQAPHSGQHTIVTTGDYIDRGPQSMEIIRDLMAYKSDRFKMINLMGNHETFMVDSKLGFGTDFWCQYNGGAATYLSYGQNMGEFPDPKYLPEDHVAWIGKLPLYYEDKHRLYVHAGCDKWQPINEQTKHNLIWMIYEGNDEGGYFDKHVVHGHHQDKGGPGVWKDRTCLDTLAWFTGRLVIGVFDDDEEGSFGSTITIQGPTIHEWREATRSVPAA